MDQIATNVYVSTQYPAVDVGFIAVEGGAIAVDAPTLPGDARLWRQAIEEATGGRILYVVLTDSHPDRLLSAGLLGAPIVASRAAYQQAAAYTDGFWRSFTDSLVRRYPSAADDLANVRPTMPEMLFTERMTLHRGGSGAVLESVAGAAPGSLWVQLAGSSVLFTGDTVTVETHPLIYAAPDTGAWLETLRVLRRDRFSETTLVPGRGPVSTTAATRPLSDYLALARRRVRSLLGAGRPRADTTTLVSELMSCFPVRDEERDWIQRRVKLGLDRLYEELRQANV